MLCLKKVYNDELLQLALILSLLRVNLDTYNQPNLLEDVGNFDIDNGTSWRTFTPSLIRSHYVHPKNLDSILLNYERDLFADLNSLGRYNREYMRHSNVTAYLLNIERANNLPTTTQDPIPENVEPVQEPQQSDNNTNDTTPVMDLTPEDMNLIEILWKQDVDLGFSMDLENGIEQDTKPFTSSPTTSMHDDNKNDKYKEIDEKVEKNVTKTKEVEETVDDDPWKGLNYTIDTETGEYVIKKEPVDDIGAECGSQIGGPLPLEDLPLPLEEFLFDEALRLVDLNDDRLECEPDFFTPKEEPNNSASGCKVTSQDSSDVLSDISDNSLDALTNMIQTSQFHPHHRPFQSRMPFVRNMSMEHRWQDFTNLLGFPGGTDGGAMHHPFSHHHPLHTYNHSHPHSMGYGPEATRGVLLHNATLAPPMGDVNGTVPFSNIGGTNLGNAVATSMNLTNSSEPMGDSNAAHYKLEPNHDIMYYQNNSNEFNQTDGLLSSILNDDDLQLMDMAMNEGMFTMRLLESNNSLGNNVNVCSGLANNTTLSRSEMERVDTSSDSAVSSMGSERVPSLSDGEWCDAGSDSGHTIGDHHYTTDYQTKYRPFDYSYSSRQHSLSTSDHSRLPPVAQKKHQMYGKRYFQDQSTANTIGHPTPIKYEYRDPSAIPTTSFTNISHPEEEAAVKASELKYSCSIEFSRHHQSLVRNPGAHIQHNHTYSLPPESSGVMPRPMSRDKIKSKKSEEEHLTRDEKRARSMNIPINVDDIINLPMDEFNERLSKYDLSEPQLSLIRDIRRRGKNKVAAQNCRKRKLDQINTLADEVKEMRDRKIRLINEYEYHTNELKRMKDKYQQLYRHVFQNLRDPEGNHYSPYHYSLQTSADGSIIVVPRSNSNLNSKEKKEHMQDHKNG